MSTVRRVGLGTTMGGYCRSISSAGLGRGVSPAISTRGSIPPGPSSGVTRLKLDRLSVDSRCVDVSPPESEGVLSLSWTISVLAVESVAFERREKRGFDPESARSVRIDLRSWS